jgi:hypothetical protein
LSAESSLYDPLHYNMGAVWPFVTGFVALAHYQYERPWAGYPLIEALGRLTFDFARGRHAELLSGRYYRPLDTAVPHQFFATSMLVSPVISGLLGWTPDAPNRRARLAPQLPPSWTQVVLRELRVGESTISLTIEQQNGEIRLTRISQNGPPVALDFAPVLPPGAVERRRTPTSVAWSGGLSIGAPASELLPGAVSTGLRVLDVVWNGATGAIEVEGQPGRAYEVSVPSTFPAEGKGVQFMPASQGISRLRITLPDASTPTVRARIPLRARKQRSQ